MKKILLFAAAATIFVACNNDKAVPDTKKDSASSVVSDAMIIDSAAVAVPDSVMMSEGDMMMRSGKMVIMKSGQWSEITETTGNANGDKVMVNGDMQMKSGMKMKFSEGEALKTNGKMLDKDGKVMDM